MALGGGEGRNFVLTLQPSFIYKSKAMDEVNPKNRFWVAQTPPGAARWRLRPKFYIELTAYIFSRTINPKILLKFLRQSAYHYFETKRKSTDFFLTYLTDIDVALHDGVVGGLVDTSGFHTNEGRLEEGLGASETLVTNGDDLRYEIY